MAYIDPYTLIISSHIKQFRTKTSNGNSSKHTQSPWYYWGLKDTYNEKQGPDLKNAAVSAADYKL